MSEMALAEGGRVSSEAELTRPIKNRLRQARDARRALEPTWQSNLAFAAGKFHLKWDRDQRRLVFPPELYGKELYTADVITEYRTQALGELSTDDDRPQLLLRQDDAAGEDYQAQLNRAIGYGWDHEWEADQALEQADRFALDMGTSAIRCRFDPTLGKPLEEDIPHYQGKPVFDPEQAMQLMGQYGEGGPVPGVTMKSINAGKIMWDPLSCFNLLVPPGIPDERRFPWEGVMFPALLDDVKEQYGALAKDLKEDGDIGNALGLDVNSEAADARGWGGGPGDAGTTRLRDHVWLYTYYERPSRKYQKGRTVVLAGNKMKLMEHLKELPYVSPNGDYRSGIAYFHWHRVTGRFWSRGLVETMKDIQRGINEVQTLKKQIIKRGLPFVIVEEGSGLEKRKGLPVEVMQIKPQSSGPPVVSQGVGPGQWMQAEVDSMRDDLEHATGIRAARLGENPANVGTYSQLALIYEADATKRQQIVRDRKRAIGRLLEDSVYDMRTYWGPEKQIMLASDDEKVQAEVFNATKIPPYFIVQTARGTTQPRTQAAKLKLIDDVAQYSLNARTPVPLQWVKESYEAGEPLDLPEQPTDDQADKAQLENHQMLLGYDVQPQYYDPPEIHIPVHRSAQIQAEQVGDQEAWQRIEQHVQLHLQVAAENAAQIGQIVPPGSLAPQQEQPGEQPPAQPPPTG